MTRYLSIFLPFIFVGIFALAACGGGGSQGDSDFSNKNLSLTVSGSKSFNPNIIHGQIDHYLMTVSADDLAAPFIERFSGEAASGKMVGIPAGTGRTILVEAVNPNGLVIRRGKAEGVTIAPGMMSHVEIVMYQSLRYAPTTPAAFTIHCQATVAHSLNLIAKSGKFCVSHVDSIIYQSPR